MIIIMIIKIISWKRIVVIVTKTKITIIISMIITADIILIIIRKKKKIIINGKEKEMHRVKMSSWSFKLLPKNIKTFGKKNNNNNNIKLKEMGITAPITNYTPTNGYVGDADSLSSMLWIIHYLSSGLY